MIPSFICKRVSAVEIGATFLCDFPSNLFKVQSKIEQNPTRNAIAFPQQTQQNMFGTDVFVTENPGLFGREKKNFFDPWCIRNVAEYFLIRTYANVFFNFRPDIFRLQPTLFEKIESASLA